MTKYRETIKQALQPAEIAIKGFYDAGYSVAEIAEVTGYSRQWVYKLLDSYKTKVVQKDANSRPQVDES